MTRAWGRGRRRSRSAVGFTLIEVTIALAIASTVLMISAGAFLSSVTSVNAARQTSRANVFLSTVLEDLSAQPYDNLPSFNGNTIYDQGTLAKSSYSVRLTIFLTWVDMQQINAVLVDVHTNRVLGRVTTYRSRT